MTEVKPVRTRFAPSPTGRTHLGSARTALYDFLLARQTAGQFILRLEDTDRRRYVPGAEEELMRSLRWLGLDWDEGPDVGGPYGPYRQSERKETYQEAALQLINNGHAYYCFCTPEKLEKVRQEQIKNKQNPRYDGTCRNLDPDDATRRVLSGERHVLRFRMPVEGSITVHDYIRGNITVENSNLDDTILVRSDGLAVYHLAAMVDDHWMKISHVIRTVEWLPTFPLHIHILRALGWEAPVFVHPSIFLKPSGKGKMSKRESADGVKDGYSIYIGDMEPLGYLPEGIINWTALMGWSFDDHTEFFKLHNLVEKFSIDQLNPSPAAINFSKLDHFNGLHIRSLEIPDLARRVKPFLERQGYVVNDDRLLQVTPLIQERLVTLDDCVHFAGFFFQEDVHPEFGDLIAKDLTAEQSASAAQRAHDLLAGLAEITLETAEEPMRHLADELGLSAGQLFGILRVAVTGQKVSPPLFESMAIIGAGKVLRRLETAVRILLTPAN